MDSAKVHLDNCNVHRNKGPGETHRVLRKIGMRRHQATLPMGLSAHLMKLTRNIHLLSAGIDVSHHASAELSGGVIRGNVGGIWLWQAGSVKLQSVSLEGGSSYVILADEDGTPSLTVRVIVTVAR